MSRFLPAVLVVLFASPAFADDKPKPNTLTPKKIADGWVQLFDGETTYGWVINGAAEVKDGELIIGKGKKTIAYPTTNFNAINVEMDWRGKAELYFTDPWSGFQISLNEKDKRFSDPSFWGYLMVIRDRVGTAHSYTGKDSVTKRDLTTPRPEFKTTRFFIETDGTTEFRIRSVNVKPTETKPLFNGKDFTGWKVFDDPKRSATKVEVTKDGELSAKNGPGDLQTEKAFDNFVLQLECKTNGKWLNSGVFFRCIPNQYQNGYECQIQNAFTGEDRTKPIDFGTGAIYRRVPARKVVSNDNEWFTMTLVADGKHFSTWVNGYQTVDWTDERPANDNPRQGYRAEKGHLSIQGHDPTTDLLFRNIRIVELK